VWDMIESTKRRYDSRQWSYYTGQWSYGNTMTMQRAPCAVVAASWTVDTQVYPAGVLPNVGPQDSLWSADVHDGN
jgi:hypothetical protein